MSHDSDRVDETPSRIRKHEHSSVMSHPLQEEMGGVFSPCIEVDEKLIACNESEEEEEEEEEGTPTPLAEYLPGGRDASRRDVTETRFQRQPHHGTTDDCVGREAQGAPQIGDDLPCEPQKLPPDASESGKPVDYSEGVVRSMFFALGSCIHETNPLEKETCDSLGTERA